jgi:hypothetical protein
MIKHFAKHGVEQLRINFDSVQVSLIQYDNKLTAYKIMRGVFFLLFLVCFPSIYCQTTAKRNNLWVSSGLGGSFWKSSSGITLYLSVDGSEEIFIQTNNSQPRHYNTTWKIRLIGVLEFYDEEIPELFGDFGILNGISFGNKFQTYLSGGIGLFAGQERVLDLIPYPSRYYHGKVFLTPGLPIELGVKFVPEKIFGAVLGGFANLNFKKSIYGFILRFELGKIR